MVVVDCGNSAVAYALYHTKTNVDGVYVVGDVRTKSLRQIVTAVSDCAVAAYFAGEYISKLN